MKLHDNPTLFNDTILALSTQKNIPTAFIEKDYWLTTVLKQLSYSKYNDDFIFKGGTSLSKAFGMIQRFSEDIDLALVAENLSGNQVKGRIGKVSKDITKHLEEVEIEQVTSKKTRFRRTAHTYPQIMSENHNSQMVSYLIVELNAFGKPHPFQTMQLSSMIFDFYQEQNRTDLIKEYELQSFPIQVLKPERTFGEKVLAIARASYHQTPELQLQNKIRHLYDLHILMNHELLIDFIAKPDFFQIIELVQKDDAESREFQGDWNKEPLTQALIFNDSDELWKSLEKTYKNSFQPLVYGSLPNINEIRMSISILKKRLEDYQNQK